MTDILDSGFESIKKIKDDLREENDEIKTMLNKKSLGKFELDRFMNGW